MSIVVDSQGIYRGIIIAHYELTHDCQDSILLLVPAFHNTTVLHKLVLTVNVDKLGNSHAELSGCGDTMLCRAGRLQQE